MVSYLNYGAIGSLIGHELTHAFDVNGRLYDASGVKNTWWSNYSIDAYRNATKCLVGKFSRYKINGNNVSNYYNE